MCRKCCGKRKKWCTLLEGAMSMPGNVLARVGPHIVPAVDMAERWKVSIAANVACERVAAVPF